MRALALIGVLALAIASPAVALAIPPPDTPAATAPASALDLNIDNLDATAANVGAVAVFSGASAGAETSGDTGLVRSSLSATGQQLQSIAFDAPHPRFVEPG